MALLENKHIKIRAIEPEDLDILYSWENNTDLWIHGNSLSPYSKLTLRQYISDAQTSDIYQAKQLRLMIDLKENSTTIGTIDLYDFDIRNKRAGIGILIDEPYRQNEYASETLDILKEYAFSFLDIHQLYAYISAGNIASIKLFERNGFEKSGTLKDWIFDNNTYRDVFIYQIINNHE